MKYIFSILTLLFLQGCDAEKLTKTPMDQFIGTWKLEGRGILENIEIEIFKNEDGSFRGKVNSLNDNKYVHLFMEVGDDIITGIQRSSNYQFTITEKKIAAPLFAAYGQNTSKEFAASFENENTILLGNNGVEGKLVRVDL